MPKAPLRIERHDGKCIEMGAMTLSIVRLLYAEKLIQEACQLLMFEGMHKRGVRSVSNAWRWGLKTGAVQWFSTYASPVPERMNMFNAK